jgi:hypothetical protein
MHEKITARLLAVSAALNALFLALFISALCIKPPSSFAFYAPEGALSAAAIASVPQGSPGITFNAVELHLKTGESAALQFSASVAGKQSNFLLDALYDHEIISVAPAGYGALITALKPGTAVMQTVGGGGIKDAAIIMVSE